MISIDKKDAYTDYVYYNININGPLYQNSLGNSTATSNFCQYNVDLSYPLLDKMSDYYMAVVRFCLPASSIPLIIPEIALIQPGTSSTPNTDPNLTNYMFAFAYAGNYYRANGEWNPQDTTQSTPLAPSATTNGLQASSPYYYCYSYIWMLNIFNAAIASAWAQMYAGHSIVGPTPPIIIYNQSSGIFSIIAPYSICQYNISFYCNSPTNALFQAIPQFIANYPVSSSPANFSDQKGFLYQFSFPYSTNTQGIQQIGYAYPGSTISTPPAYVQLSGEYTCFEYWPVLNSIVLSSPTTKIKYESLNQGFGNLSSAQPNFTPILQDFIPPLDNANDPRSILIYNASVYRLIDMISNEPLTKISLYAYWTDSYNNLYPITLQNGEQASFKLMFVRKDAIRQNPNLLKRL